MKTVVIKFTLAIVICAGIASAAALFLVFENNCFAQEPRDFGWDDVPAFSMRGGLKAYWNVGNGPKDEIAIKAYARGFSPLTVINSYADYPGKQQENIHDAVGNRYSNPWQKPPFFERIIRRNIDLNLAVGSYIHDIELSFEEDPELAWKNEEARHASGALSREEFDEAYFRQWAEWFWLPLQWTKERYLGTPVGLYGVQPFRRDYWGIAGKDASQIDGTHKSDWRLWKYIDHYADFYIASIYVFYDRPDSVFYMAANVEENYLRTRALGNKPVCAYTWLRFHDSNSLLKGKELPPYLVEAMAIVPYFSGAKGVVLWGWEPQVKGGNQQPYARLPLFARSLARVAALSQEIAHGQLQIDQPAHDGWKARRPLIRRVMIGENKCAIMAINPWQGDNELTTRSIQCGQVSAEIVMEGRHTMLAILDRTGLRTY